MAQGIKYPTISNHISALKYQFIRFNLASQVLDSRMVLRVPRSIDKNVPRPLVQKSVFTDSRLVSLIQLAQRQPLADFLEPLFYWGSLLFYTLATYFQNLDIIGVSTAVSHFLFHQHPLPQDAPCFAYISQGHLVSLTQMQARLALKRLCQQLNLPYNQLGFHAFKRSGVAFLLANGVPLTNLKQHGTWNSDAIFAYLNNSATMGCVPHLLLCCKIKQKKPPTSCSYIYLFHS